MRDDAPLAAVLARAETSGRALAGIEQPLTLSPEAAQELGSAMLTLIASIRQLHAQVMAVVAGYESQHAQSPTELLYEPVAYG
jgi:hypothetical protein